MNNNKTLIKAKQIKDDEFYTRLVDVEKELEMYEKEIWRDKVVFCNCNDNPNTSSAFYKYFLGNFQRLELKRLICTYEGHIFTAQREAKHCRLNSLFDQSRVVLTYEAIPGYTGKFDDPLSLKILNEEADIVCTNPPFSQSIKYIKTVMESKKRFIIILNKIAVQYKIYMESANKELIRPGFNSVEKFINEKGEIQSGPGHWFCNLPISARQKYSNLKIIPLTDIPDKHKTYDDIGTLVVNNCYIPSDYGEPFAVSITPILSGVLEKGFRYAMKRRYDPVVRQRRCFARALIRACGDDALLKKA